MRADVLADWADHDDFPHQSTADQFFEESQFESYRALGEQITQQAFVGAENFTDGNRLREVFDRAALARLPTPARARGGTPPSVTPPTYRA